MQRERGAKSVWDLKLAPGGLVDIEFIVQALQLAHAADAPQALSPNTGEALQRLRDADKLDASICAELTEAWMLWSALQHLLRICVAGEFAPDAAPPPLLERLAALGGAPDFEALEEKVRAVQARVRAAFVQLIGPLGDGSQALRR
jgi:glutamate-ammonia-ligase adenylyltransferase